MSDRQNAVASRALDHAPSVGGLVQRAADEFGERTFLEDAQGAVTYLAAAEIVARGASCLRTYGIAVGARVGICLPNGVDWPLAWLSVLGAGLTAVPINRSYEARDIEHVVQDSDLIAVITSDEFAPKFEGSAADTQSIQVIPINDVLEHEPVDAFNPPRPAIDGSTLANLQYTSGTSGLPKACMLTHSYWIEVGRAMGEMVGLTEGDRLLTAQPFSYMDPMWHVTMSLQYGAPLVILPRFSASTFWADVRRHGTTVLYVLGSMPQLLFGQPPSDQDQDNDVRLVLCSAIPAAIHRQLEERWQAPWREAYGLTESGLNIAAPLDDERSVGLGLLGVPTPGWKVRVVDENLRDVPPDSPGELLVSGPSLMRGYWRRPEATEAALRDGWFRTGDLAVMREDGWIRLVGRIKDSIRRGGENIAAVEVEETIRELPFVRDCAVVGVDDNLFGQEVKAHVEITEPGDPHELASRVAEHAGARLARFKIPRYVDFWTSLPRTPSERIAKHRIPQHPAREFLASVDLGQQGSKKS
ncbi:AMP-binding protein [Sphaerisporangium sp. NPDC051011]|uniref:class I adenylate-forming enzyme family protein n=1 Tax=Sphaerisporangium sp. NPDC051011 TaxID=3155792 RepID=UPI0033FEDD3F